MKSTAQVLQESRRRVIVASLTRDGLKGAELMAAYDRAADEPEA